MPIETTYTDARANLATLMDRVVDDAETVLIRRKNGKAVAIVSADELASLQETAHLLQSPRNRERLMSALKSATAGRGKRQAPGDLRRELGL
jgi:antitoxin YefM